MTRLNSSREHNRQFANDCSRLSIAAGVELHVARNIIRFNRGLKSVRHTKKVWCDVKTGLPLTQKQWESKSLRLARIVKDGGSSRRDGRYDQFFDSNQDPDVTYGDALDNGMCQYGDNRILLTREQGYALDRMDAEAMKNPAMHNGEN